MNDAKKTAGAQHCCAVVISVCDVTIDLLSGVLEWDREKDHLQRVVDRLARAYDGRERMPSLITKIHDCYTNHTNLL